jgi:DNA-binding Xre family transcriptional regulator
MSRRNPPAAPPPAEIARLERMLDQLRACPLPPVPRDGWIRTLRAARGISSRALARCLDVSQSAVIQAEQHEAAGTISMLTLHRMAKALDCELRYALVPKPRRRR